MARWMKLLGSLIVLAVAGYWGYVQVRGWHERSLKGSLEREKAEWTEQAQRMEEQISELKEELALQKEADLPREKLEEVFGQDSGEVLPRQGEDRCRALDRRIKEFFAYLDERDYVQARQTGESTFQVFQKILARLSEAPPPVVSGEMKDPYLLLKNVAHFYRVLDKKELGLVRAVLAHESEIAEPVGALLFEWLSCADQCEQGRGERVSWEVLYEYAGFFLNTLAGKGYLLRRDPRVRILTTYYSVLILDHANDQDLNRYGIDIRPHLEVVAKEIRSQRGLVYQKQYLDRLESLKRKYAVG